MQQQKTLKVLSPTPEMPSPSSSLDVSVAIEPSSALGCAGYGMGSVGFNTLGFRILVVLGLQISETTCLKPLRPKELPAWGCMALGPRCLQSRVGSRKMAERGPAAAHFADGDGQGADT